MPVTLSEALPDSRDLLLAKFKAVSDFIITGRPDTHLLCEESSSLQLEFHIFRYIWHSGFQGCHSDECGLLESSGKPQPGGQLKVPCQVLVNEANLRRAKGRSIHAGKARHKVLLLQRVWESVIKIVHRPYFGTSHDQVTLTSAEFVSTAMQVIVANTSCQRPMSSAPRGTGRCICVSSLKASDRVST